ncbi:MAG: NAD(P)H-binding protein, partial [Bryobacterales bacterium]|nr:NAD(P)H-binding protein [Bryobacterales bacterium]
MAHVFVSGGTGFLGARIIARLLERGHTVAAVARPGSEHKLPRGTGVVTGDPLHEETFASYMPPADTFIHLVGITKPAPWKGAAFRAVDQVSLEQSLIAAKAFGIKHFVYVSVAHPAPVMRAYIEVRKECERQIRLSG